MEYATLKPVVDDLVTALARIDADLIAQHGVDGQRAFKHAEDTFHHRRARLWQEHHVA